MRALAHPRRLQLLRHLRAAGPATATQLGAATAQSAASASYHLRQLSAHGFVEEIPGRGAGRERWWQARFLQTRIDADAFDAPESRTAAMAVAAAMLGDATSVVLAFLDAAERGEVERDWLDAARLDDTAVLVTPEELNAIGRQMAAVLEPFERRRTSDSPLLGVRLCHMSLQLVPVIGS